jgi:hypothetical protein
MAITNVTEKSAVSVLVHFAGDVEKTINHIVTQLASQASSQPEE